MKSAMWEDVEQILRAAAAEVVMPAFAAGAPAADVDYKSVGEPVTAADREAEALISRELLRLLPGALVIGEEACAADPALLSRLGAGRVWLVDPIDGTGNFAAGRGPFALMVALLEDGELRGSCILQPLVDVLAVAELGGGAWINDQRVQGHGGESRLDQLVGIVSEAFVPNDRKPLLAPLRQEVAEVLPTARCAGHEYPQVATGKRDFAIYWRTLAWDHAPGALLLREAGGSVTHLDGQPYRPTEPRGGLLLARTPQIAASLLQVLGTPGSTGEASAR